MAAADEILGISGQMDISDIQQSFDKLINDLNSLGVKTDEVSSKMTKALNDIAQSSASDGEKTKQSVQTLKQGIEEINKSLTDTPEALKKLASEAQTAEASVDKLKKKLSETTEGSQKWNEINEQLKSQQSLVEKLNGEYSSMLGTFGSTQQYVGTLNAAIDTLNAGRSISTATTGANAAAHVGAAAAVGTEAIAHGENSTKIAEETEKTQQNTQAKLHLTESAKDYVYTTQMEAEAIDAVAKRLAEGRSDEEEYINSKKSGLAVRETLVQKIEEEKQKIKELSDAYANSQDANNGVATPETQKAYNEGVKEATDNIKEYRSELSSLNQSLDNLESSHFKAQQAINGQTDATQNLKQATEEAKDASDIYFNGEKATIEGVTEALKLDYQELKQLKAEYATYKGAGDTENAKKNLEEQKELNKHISEGRDVLKQLGTSYEDAARGAKKTKEETKEVAKSADEAAKKVGGIFSKFKSVLGGALKGDFSGLFSLFGKIGIWGAGLGTLGKGIYELTIRAEEFRNALQPLSHYLDESNLQAVRQNILSLSDETAKSVSDMAAAATQFAKVWDSLRESPEALTTMIKSSNEFGALAGKTSAEGAKFLSNLASEYHMTAQEATEASSMIATAARNSTSSFGEMADAISSAGSSAALYGVSFKEMTTLIGYSSNQFGGAQKAASKFSMLLMSMSKMQDKYNPSVVGMITALQNLKDAYDRGEHVENNFMARQRSIAMYFIKNADAIAKYNKGIDSNAAKQELLNDINAKASTNVAKLQNSWNGFLTAINANLTPTLTRILNFFTKIIGGAQRTADELNYLKNFDNNHKGAKRGMQYTKSVTSGWTAGFQESTVANMGARQQYNYSKEDGLKLYQQQRDRLKRIYQQGLKNAQNTWKHASSNAYAKSAGNFMLQYYNKNRSSFSEFTPQMFNDLLRNQRNSTISLLQKPINSNTNLGGNGYVPKPKKDKSADQQRNYREQLAEQQAKQLADDKKIEWELYVAEQEEGIAKEHDANEKELKQRKLDFEKKKHQIEEEAETLRQKNIQIAKAEYSKNPANKKKEGFYASGLDKGVKLTDEQQQLIEAKMSTLNAQQEEDAKKRLAAQLQSLYDYLKEYGTVQEQRYAIAKEYDDKIMKATDDNQKKILQKQKEAALAQTDAKKLAMGIDWGTSFAGIGNVLKDIAKDTLSKVEEYMKTANFKSLPATDKKSYVDLRNNLRAETNNNGSFGFSKWDDVANDVRAYQNSVKWLQKVTKAHDDAIADRDKAEKDIKNAISDKAKEIAKIKLEGANKRVEETGKAQTDAENGVQEAQQKLQDSTTDAANGLQNFQSMLSNITNGSLSGFVKGIGQLITSLSGGTSKVGEALANFTGKIGGLVGAILSLIDALGDNPTEFIDNLLDKIAKVIEAVISQLPQIIWTVVKGVGNVVGGIVKGIANIFSGGTAFGSNVSKMEKEIAELSASNQELSKAISDLSESIRGDDNTNQQSVEAYKKAVAAQKEYNQNQQQQIKNRAREYSNTGHGFLGLGGRSSFNSHANDNKGVWLNAFNETLRAQGFNTSVYSASDVWNLSPEMLKALRDYAPKAWSNFFSKGSGGKANPQSLVDDYIEQAGKLEELTDALNQKLTGYSWSGFKDSYSSMIKDCKKETTDFADFINDTISNAIVDSFMNSEVNKAKLKKIYQMVADAASDGNIDENEVANIRRENEKYADYVISWRDSMIKAGLIKDSSTTEQTATGKGIEAITADQASSLIGIGYAVQIALEQGNEIRKTIAEHTSYLRLDVVQIKWDISEMRDIQYQGLQQLEAINKNTAPIILIREDIANMYKLMKDKY